MTRREGLVKEENMRSGRDELSRASLPLYITKAQKAGVRYHRMPESLRAF